MFSLRVLWNIVVINSGFGGGQGGGGYNNFSVPPPNFQMSESGPYSKPPPSFSKPGGNYKRF